MSRTRCRCAALALPLRRVSTETAASTKPISALLCLSRGRSTTLALLIRYGRVGDVVKRKRFGRMHVRTTRILVVRGEHGHLGNPAIVHAIHSDGHVRASHVFTRNLWDERCSMTRTLRAFRVKRRSTWRKISRVHFPPGKSAAVTVVLCLRPHTTTIDTYFNRNSNLMDILDFKTTKALETNDICIYT